MHPKNWYNKIILFYIPKTEGHNGINLLPLDPLYIPKLTILQGEESPVNVDLSFKDNYMYGLKDAQFYKIE